MPLEIWVILRSVLHRLGVFALLGAILLLLVGMFFIAPSPYRVEWVVANARPWSMSKSLILATFRHDILKCPVDFVNRSDREVQIVSFRTSCKCSRAEPHSVVIPPHATSPVVFTIDLHGDPTHRSANRNLY